MAIHNPYSCSDNMEIAMKIVGDMHKGFRLCHFNARSFSKHKADYLSYLLSVLKADVICITETWFRPHVDDGYCQIVGYNVVRHDRTLGVRGGGIALYIKDGLYYKVVSKSGDDSIVEYLGVVVGGDTAKSLVLCVYNPHRSNCVDEVFRVLARVMKQTNLGKHRNRPSSSFYLPFLLAEREKSESSRNFLLPTKNIGSNLSFGFSSIMARDGGTNGESKEGCNNKSILENKTIFGCQQTVYSKQNSPNYIEPVKNHKVHVCGSATKGLFNDLLNDDNEVINFKDTYNDSFILSSKNGGLPNRTNCTNFNLSTHCKQFWVTVYGFPAENFSLILQHFAQCGTIVDKVFPSSRGNWIHFKYTSQLECTKALTCNGMILANNIMIGVTECKDEDLIGKGNIRDNITEFAKVRPLAKTSKSEGENSVITNACTVNIDSGLLNKALDLFFGW
uniref:Nucleoporin NUP35 n=1 Tax=Glossina brevipalpis TaxID=37001 RepID=A0A1A9WSD6_9MUSC